MKRFLMITAASVLLCGQAFAQQAAVMPTPSLSSTSPLGMVPSASLGQAREGHVFGLYEPAGGTAPDIAGRNLANPIAQIISVALMMQFSFQLTAVHDAIVGAVGRAIAAGYRTGDIFNAADSAAKKVGTCEMGDAIAALL